MTRERRRIVIIGGSYAGLRVARDISRVLSREEAEIILIAKEDYHTDVPELYEIATAYLRKESTLSTEHIYPGSGVAISELLHHNRVTVKIGTVQEINTTDRLLFLNDATSFSYDWLVLAVGAPVATYGISGVVEHAFSIKTLSEALRLRHHTIRTLLAAHQMHGSEQQAARRFVIIGAGATGVELATELSGLIKKFSQEREHNQMVPEIILLEAGPTILRELRDVLRHTVQERLESLGVDVRVNQAVERIEENHVFLKTGEEIHAHTVVWSGGLRADDLLIRSKLPINNRGVIVGETLQVEGQPNIFAAGDCAVLSQEQHSVPAIVPVAYTQGTVVARNIIHAVRSEPLELYHYKPTGQLITLGGKKVLFVWPSQRGMIGIIPWLMKQFVNLRYWAWYLPLWKALKLTMKRLSVQTKND